MLVERGDWLYSTFDKAYYAYMRDDYESAQLYYMLAAEKGYELAQSNVAWLLDERMSIFVCHDNESMVIHLTRSMPVH
jgi:TPR repeat protein